MHTGALATASADAVNARAYTVGNQVVLGDNPADPRPGARTRPCRAVRGRAAAFAAAAGENDRRAARHEARPVRNSARSRNGVRSGRCRGCEKFPSIPGCGTVCSLFGCKKQDTPKRFVRPIGVSPLGAGSGANAARARPTARAPAVLPIGSPGPMAAAAAPAKWSPPTSTAYRAPRRHSGRCPSNPTHGEVLQGFSQSLQTQPQPGPPGPSRR